MKNRLYKHFLCQSHRSIYSSVKIIISSQLKIKASRFLFFLTYTHAHHIIIYNVQKNISCTCYDFVSVI